MQAVLLLGVASHAFCLSPPTVVDVAAPAQPTSLVVAQQVMINGSAPVGVTTIPAAHPSAGLAGMRARMRIAAR